MTNFRESNFKREKSFAEPTWSKSIDIKQCENTNDPRESILICRVQQSPKVGCLSSYPKSVYRITQQKHCACQAQHRQGFYRNPGGIPGGQKVCKERSCRKYTHIGIWRSVNIVKPVELLGPHILALNLAKKKARCNQNEENATTRFGIVKQTFCDPYFVCKHTLKWHRGIRPHQSEYEPCGANSVYSGRVPS